MGYFQDDHIKKFCKGQTIENIEVNEGIVCFKFINGESLKFYSVISEPIKKPKTTIISVPYKSDGEVKQSLEIEKEEGE